MKDEFYRSFEEIYYASSEHIKHIRKQYVPFVLPLLDFSPHNNTFDLGCGRGEWLELMSDLGCDAKGCDLDEGMLQACYALNLPAFRGDIVEESKKLPDNSQLIISAFHVVEHITNNQLMEVIENAHRALVPGGLLIMETPNPENILVGSNSFYLDPTHIRPIPDMLLAFMVRYCGFEKIKTLRLQEDKNLLTKSDLRLLDVLKGVSPDYAVIGQKAGSSEMMSSVEFIFSLEYGLSLSRLAEKYEDQKTEAINNLLHLLSKAESKIESVDMLANDLREDFQKFYTVKLRFFLMRVKNFLRNKFFNS